MSGRRIKAEQNDMMHLKAYAIDGRWLRTGSANFSWSGETRQDNDIVIIDSPQAAGDFTRHFEKLWARRDNTDADAMTKIHNARRARRRGLGHGARQYGGGRPCEGLAVGA